MKVKTDDALQRQKDQSVCLTVQKPGVIVKGGIRARYCTTRIEVYIGNSERSMRPHVVACAELGPSYN